MPSLTKFTLCLWMKSSDATNAGTPFSYNTPGRDNTILLHNYGSFEFFIYNKFRYCLLHTNLRELNILTRTLFQSELMLPLTRLLNFFIYMYKNGANSGALAHEARQRRTMGKKWSNLPIWENLEITWPYTACPPARPRDRSFAPQAYQCKITQSTGMATEMQLEAILAGNRIAISVL